MSSPLRSKETWLSKRRYGIDRSRKAQLESLQVEAVVRRIVGAAFQVLVARKSGGRKVGDHRDVQIRGTELRRPTRVERRARGWLGRESAGLLVPASAASAAWISCASAELGGDVGAASSARRGRRRLSWRWSWSRSRGRSWSRGRLSLSTRRVD